MLRSSNQSHDHRTKKVHLCILFVDGLPSIERQSCFNCTHVTIANIPSDAFSMQQLLCAFCVRL